MKCKKKKKIMIKRFNLYCILIRKVLPRTCRLLVNVGNMDSRPICLETAFKSEEHCMKFVVAADAES